MQQRIYNFKNISPVVLHDGDEHFSLLFHLEQEDYFGTLATILNLLRQSTTGKHKTVSSYRVINSLVLEKVVDDLLYLQKNYQIVKKK